MSRTRPLTSVVLAAVTALALAGAAHAQVKPFQITGVGVGTEGLPLAGEPARPHWDHRRGHPPRPALRRRDRQDRLANLDLAHGVITGEFGAGSPFTFYGANGEQMVTWYGRTNHGAARPGTYTLTIVGFDAARRPSGS